MNHTRMGVFFPVVAPGSRGLFTNLTRPHVSRGAREARETKQHRPGRRRWLFCWPRKMVLGEDGVRLDGGQCIKTQSSDGVGHSLDRSRKTRFRSCS